MQLPSWTFVESIGVIFVVCFIATTALTPVAMKLARRVGAVDHGGYRKVYRGEIPLLGGFGISTPLILATLIAGALGHFSIRNWEWVWLNYKSLFDTLMTFALYRYECLTFAIGGIAIVILGIVDDAKGMRARKKLMGQVAVALFACVSGWSLTTVAVPFFGTFHLGALFGGVLTLLWIVGLVNAFNLIDGIDGLAAGISFVGAVALVALSVIQQNPFVTILCAMLAGSLLAFLRFNFPPAKIFLGDTGSMFLGYSLAMASLMGAQKSDTVLIILAPILALSFPIFETFVSMLRRYINGVPIFSGDNRHTHHLLLRKGYSQPNVVLMLSGTAFILATAAVLAALIPEKSLWAWSPYALYVATLVGVAWLAGYLRPASFKVVIERHYRNKTLHSLGRYVRQRLDADSKEHVAPELLLELCRMELGLVRLDVRTPDGERIMAASHDEEEDFSELPVEKLFVKTSDGADIMICFEFTAEPAQSWRQDVNVCLAGIFNEMKIEHSGMDVQ